MNYSGFLTRYTGSSSVHRVQVPVRPAIIAGVVARPPSAITPPSEGWKTKKKNTEQFF